MYKIMCRLCGEHNGTSYIFSHSECIFLKITYCCTRIAVFEEGDGLPAFICDSCNEELDKTYNFLLKCEKTDLHLRSAKVNGTMSAVVTVKEGHDPSEPKVEAKGEDNEMMCTSNCENQYEASNSCMGKKNISSRLKGKRSVKKTPKVEITCSVCEYTTTSASALAVHIRKHTDETPHTDEFQCPECSKKYKDKRNLINHIKKHHSAERTRNFICDHCGKGFFTKSCLKIHMRTHTGETPYECTECSMRFNQIGALIRHKKRHSGDKPHACTICGKTFSIKESLKNHSKAHSDEQNYLCNICNTPFKYQNSLRKHMLLHSAPNSFICHYCGRTFNQKGNLKIHIESQHSEKSGYCNICLKNVSHIEVHMWRHTGQRPLKCEFCPNSFFELKTLARHINYRHKNPDKFKCNYEGCNRTFPAKPMLEFHTAKLHKTGIPFPCDRCTRGFYRKADLARHKIGTHKERQ